MIAGGVIACSLFLFGIAVGFALRAVTEPGKSSFYEHTSRPMTPQEKARFDEAFAHADRAFQAADGIFKNSPPSHH